MSSTLASTLSSTLWAPHRSLFGLWRLGWPSAALLAAQLDWLVLLLGSNTAIAAAQWGSTFFSSASCFLDVTRLVRVYKDPPLGGHHTNNTVSALLACGHDHTNKFLLSGHAFGQALDAKHDSPADEGADGSDELEG